MPASARFIDDIDDKDLSIAALIETVGEGLATAVLDRVARAYGLTQQSMADLIDVPKRTLQRRRAADRFDRQESERLYRYIRLYQRALEVFDGDDGSARIFLTETQPGLDGAIPIELARSELGAAEIMDLLGQIDLGMYT